MSLYQSNHCDFARAWNSCRHCTPPPGARACLRRFVDSIKLFVCIWVPVWSVSCCCPTFPQQFIACCHWFSSSPITSASWGALPQPPKKALDYVQDHSPGVSNGVKNKLLSFFKISFLGAVSVILNIHVLWVTSIYNLSFKVSLHHCVVSSIITAWTLVT